MRKTTIIISILAGILVLSAIVVLAGNAGVTTVSETKSESAPKSLTEHAPIYINGNADFSDADDDGVSNPGAAGTEGNPYIIENWDINASTANGIDIENTNKYFIIRNCVIYDGKSNYKYGIFFYSVQNCKIENVTSYNNHVDISLQSSSNNNTITNCAVYNNSYGIELYSSSNNNQITNCAVYNNSDGIELEWYSSNNNIINCNVYNNSWAGIGLYSFSNNNQITNCAVYNNYYGILLSFSSNNTITNCTIYNNSGIGIHPGYSLNNNITNCAVYNNIYGIKLDYYSNNNQITNCDVYNNYYGIVLDYSSNNNITNCSVYNNSWEGIVIASVEVIGGVEYSSNNNITNCAVYNNSGSGIYLGDSPNNNITNCAVYNNIYGIELSFSSNNNIIGNTFTNNGIFICDESLEYYTQNIDTTNLVNGKPLYYFLNQNNLNIDNWAIGQLILVNCTNSIIKNVNISHTDIGIELAFSKNISITNCNVYNNYHGIRLQSSSNNNITNCDVYNNSREGIYLWSSSNSNITNCAVYNNSYGIELYSSSNNNQITNCAVYNNSDGIELEWYSSNNNITNCNVYNNSWAGIGLYSFSNNNQITNCSIYNNYYCGIFLVYSSNNNITNCDVYNNSGSGIYLSSSSNNEIHYNNIYNNSEYGVYNYNSGLEYQVNATYNWWGSASGPYNPSSNPNGTGNRVSDNVLYIPWLTAPWICEIPNQPPTAFMDPILPNPATQGQTVTFTGRGYDSDGSIVAYNWRSSIDGQLSTSDSFTTSTLSVGTHTIYFKVQDNNWTWSSEVSGVLMINPLIQPTLTVTVNANPITINSSGASTITITVTNGTTPISGATINLVSNNSGGFSSVTDNGNGTYTAIFTAPSVTTQTICRITATASKTGYNNGSGYVDVTVNPVTVNHAPIVNSITANPTTVSTSGTVTVTIDASDADVGDTLTYYYDCTGGTISGSGSSVTWTASSTAGDYTVTVYVNDSKVNSNSKSVSVTVTSPEKEKPKGFIPGFETFLLLIVFTGYATVGIRRRKKALPPEKPAG